MATEKKWLTPKEAGSLSGYTARHIQNMIVCGKIPATKEDGRYYIEREDFLKAFPKADKRDKDGNFERQTKEIERLSEQNQFLMLATQQKDDEIRFLRDQVHNLTHEKQKLMDSVFVTKEKINTWKKIFG